MIGGMRQSTTNALVQRFTGSPTDVVGFSNALRHLAASSSREQALGVLLTEAGEVLAISSPAGRVSTWAQVSLDEVEPIEVEVEGDGWFRTEHTLFYVHRARPWVLTRRGRLALSVTDQLPPEAVRLPDEAVTHFMIVAADCIELFAESEAD